MEFYVFRLLQRYVLLCLLLIPLEAWSLGLGDVTVESLRNYPLRAKIELLAVRTEELSSLRAKLASPRDFDWIGIKRPEILLELEFGDPIRVGDNTYITVTTRNPINESVLNFLVEAQWAAGRLLREYTIRLEPADTSTTTQFEKSFAQSPKQKGKIIPTPKTNDIAQKIPQERAASEIKDIEETGKTAYQQTYRSVPGDTLSGIARKFLPQTLTDNKVNRLRMMMAVLEANPESFIDNNINGLKSNASLIIPSASQVQRINQEQVIAEFTRQNELWRNRSYERTTQAGQTEDTKPIARSQEPVKTTPMPKVKASNKVKTVKKSKEGETTESTPEDGKPGIDPVLTKRNTAEDQPLEDSARLSIISEQTLPVKTDSFTIASSDYIANLERSVTLAQELAESRRRETEEIRSRVNRLESVIAQQERLIDLQNDQMSELNDRLRQMTQPKDAPDSSNSLWFIGIIAALVLLLTYLVYKYVERRKA